MNKLPCPGCGKSLFWGGVRQSHRYDLKGKRWYEYVPPMKHCKACGVGVRFTKAATEFKFVAGAWILGPFVSALSYPFNREVAIGVALLAALGLYLIRRSGRYEKVNDE